MADMLKESLSQVDSMLNTMKRLNEFSMGIMNKMITDGLKSWQKQPCSCEPSSSENYHGISNDAGIICPPQDKCLPRCILTIVRHGNRGDVIRVPFRISNKTHSVKTWHLGVREIVDQDGTPICHPSLDKLELTVQPEMSAVAEMKVVINDRFTPGSLYETDIVIREKRHNQNICFRLFVDAEKDIPEASPYDEKDIDTHFHRWYHHYYCENKSQIYTIENK
jgi:hypothetical protein